MKQYVFYAFACALLLTGCNNESSIQEVVENQEKLCAVRFDVLMKKEVQDFPVTRSMPVLDVHEPVVSKANEEPDPDASVQELADLCSRIEYIVYKLEETPVLFKHIQYTLEDMDFGIVYDSLPHGSYQFCFLAHSSEEAELSGSVLAFDKVSDTFYSSFSKSIEPAESVSEDVTLNRIVSRIEFKATDTIPAELEHFDMTVTGLSDRFDLADGEGILQTVPQKFVYTFSPEEIGKKDNIHSFYTFLSPGSQGLSTHLEAFDESDVLIRERIIDDIRPEANKIIRYSGRIYSRSESDDTFQLSIFENGVWADTISVDLPEI